MYPLQASRDSVVDREEPPIQHAHIMRLPNEITWIIFMYATSELITAPNSSLLFNYSNVEVHISHVCRDWRALSLALSSLWTRFCYLAHHTSTCILERLDAYLERSGKKPLSIWVDLRGNSQLQIGVLMMERMIDHIDRWRQFVFRPDSTFPIDDFLLRIKPRAAPNLELLSLAFASANRKRLASSQHNEPIILTGGVPKLVTLWIDTAAWKYLPSMSNITTLHIKQNLNPIFLRPPQEKLLAILSSPSLTTLTLDGNDDQSYMFETTASRPIITPNLKTLRIRNQMIYRGLINWKAPLLETLILEQVWFEEDQENVAPYIHPFPSLRALAIIDNEPYSHHCGVALSQLTGNIEDLIISDGRRPGPLTAFVSILGLLDHGKQGWPRLQSVTLNVRHLGGRDYIGGRNPYFLVRCLQARPQTSHPILKIDNSLLEIWKRDYADYLEELEHLCAIQPLASSFSTIPAHWPANLNAGPFSILFERVDTPFVPKYTF